MRMKQLAILALATDGVQIPQHLLELQAGLSFDDRAVFHFTLPNKDIFQLLVVLSFQQIPGQWLYMLDSWSAPFGLASTLLADGTERRLILLVLEVGPIGTSWSDGNNLALRAQATGHAEISGPVLNKARQLGRLRLQQLQRHKRNNVVILEK